VFRKSIYLKNRKAYNKKRKTKKPVSLILHHISVNTLKPKKRYRRGYPVAILIGLEENTAALWQIFSKVAKPEKTVYLNGTRNNPKDVYNFHEAIINAVRPTLKEGVRSIILATPPRTTYNQELINHIQEHHKWLTQGPNKAVFSTITAAASTIAQVAELTRTSSFYKLISETTQEEAENLIQILEKRINMTDNTNLVLFSLEEAETLIVKRHNPNEPKPDYLLITDKYLTEKRQKNRLHRLIQIATNKQVKTRIIKAESPTGKRITQFGGFICLAQPN
jgi:stalled ribosome rescue protein Dom34